MNQEILDAAKQAVDNQEEKSVRDILQRVTEAQSALGENISNKEIRKHLRDVLYPILAATLNKVGDCGDAIEDLFNEREDGEGSGLPEEEAKYIDDYIDITFSLIQDLIEPAKTQAASGDPMLLEKLRGIHQLGLNVKEIISVYREDSAEVE